MHVVLHHRVSCTIEDRVAALRVDGLEVQVIAPDDPTGFEAALNRVEVIWHVLTPITGEHIARAPRLRLIQKIGVGLNTIDLTAARSHGVAVCNMPGTNTQAVAEHTLLLMLACLRRLPTLHADTLNGEGWPRPVEEMDAQGEIAGRTVGLLGYGAVPARLAPILAAMGARVLFCSRSPKLGAVGERVDLERLLEASDVLSLHVPLDEQTRGVVSRTALARMKRGAVLINTARGELVDDEALRDALASGALGAAGLDVFAREPLPPRHPLQGAPNLVLSPHVAWLTRETIERSLDVATLNCRRLDAGEALLHRVT